MEEVAIISAKRTAIGSFLGSLKNTNAIDLASVVCKEILKESNLQAEFVEELILGQILQAGLGQNPARQIALKAGMGTKAGAYVVNKLCGSGLKAIALAAQSIMLGEAEIILAGGVENMSLSPFLLENVRNGYRMGDRNLIDSMLKDALTCSINNYHMGITAENLAKQYKISRKEQDEFALLSQQKATKAIKEGKFKEEIVPITLQNKGEARVFDTDEFVKKDLELQSLSSLKPVFSKEGSVTSGNSSGINDGAAFVLLTTKAKAKELNLPILATLKAFASIGVEPSIMGIGAAMAAKKVLEKTKMQINDMDLIESNEAFAAQSLACLKEFQPKLDRVNVNGGAIALGHPVGASGARIVVTLLQAMKRQNKQWGLATLCVGGGAGIAAIFERSGQ
ncbi:acetyl-CoA C-acetyltransferase [Helicobacter apodemus]|uniref:Acetyl-CoA C-acetyltransferase n=1 Tax=Helicobacter apodemus TaxID=135569 RepID=A0A4U8UE34_9HELI|nr:acetyl-CoA C-acetyltransferase [Helicobacter apodemus]TLE16016.1 acetyl-CoA C-acetyltransferase [Helicobacter apodemus]